MKMMMQSKDASLASVRAAGVTWAPHQIHPATRMAGACQRWLPVTAGLHILSVNASHATHSHASTIIMLALATCQEMDGQASAVLAHPRFKMENVILNYQS